MVSRCKCEVGGCCYPILCRKELWSLRLIDSVLNMEAVETTVFVALAEGSVAIIKVFGDF